MPVSPTACWVGLGKVSNLHPEPGTSKCTSKSANRTEGSDWSVSVSSDLQQRRTQCLLHESCKQYVTLALSLHASFFLKLSSLQNVSALEMFVPAGVTFLVNLHRCFLSFCGLRFCEGVFNDWLWCVCVVCFTRWLLGHIKASLIRAVGTFILTNKSSFLCM